MYGFRWTSRAARHLFAISDWWKGNRELAPSRFDDEVEQAIDLARRHPEAGEAVRMRGIPGARRLVLPKTGYLFVYRVDEAAQKVVIETIRSGKRRAMHRRRG